MVSNGNTTDYTSCTGAGEAGELCQSDGLTPVTNSKGAVLPDISDGGSLVIGENDFETINAYVRGAALQSADNATIAGHNNVFIVGATLDYAQLNFFSGTQVGTINSQLFVNPSDLIVDTPESSPFGGNPVYLKGINRNVGACLTDTFDVTQAFAVTASARQPPARSNAPIRSHPAYCPPIWRGILRRSSRSWRTRLSWVCAAKCPASPVAVRRRGT